VKGTLKTLARQPQTLWLRRALFQVHLWAGLAASLYVLVICLSGSAIVYRHEMDLALCPRIIMVPPSGPRLSEAQLAAAAVNAARRRPGGAPSRVEVRGPRVPGAAVEVRYAQRGVRLERLLDPYTGRDLGDAVACEPVLVTKLANLHDDLLGGRTGRTVNGAGSIVVLLMCLTGIVIWWPGVSRWRRSLTLRCNVPWRRFVWDLHSVLGIWMLVPILMWAASGIYLGFPGGFTALESLIAHSASGSTADAIDAFTEWLVRLHFGRAWGPWIKLLWLLLGLTPVALLVTGSIMWWNRVLRRSIGRSGALLPAGPAPGPDETPDTAG
jgi:uncharacterized iron-regulated membrane protein